MATALVALALIAGWLWLTLGGVVSDLFLPPPGELWDAFLDLLREGYRQEGFETSALTTLTMILAGASG